MKILQLVTSRQYRGAEVFAAELSGALTIRGHEVVYAGLYPAPSNQLVAEGSTNLDLNGKKKFLDFKLLRRLIKLIREFKPDIIQANGSDTLKYAVFAKYFLNDLRIVYRNISIVSSWSATGSFKRAFNRFLFKKVDFVTSVGTQSLNDLIHSYNYDSKKTQVINRGVPKVNIDFIEARKALCEIVHCEASAKILLHIGRFSPEKNHQFLIDAFTHIEKKIPDVYLLFIGEGDELKKIIGIANGNNKIVFGGHHNNVQQLAAGADLLLLGRKIEGVPGVIIEAAMQKVPVVAVAVGGVSEVVINGETGITIPDHDVKKFSAAVVELLQNDSVRKRLGETAYNKVASRYSIESCVSSFEKLYNDLTS